MSFRITGLSPKPFRTLFDLSDEALHRIGALRVIADDPRMPCRVSMAHADPGEELLLLNYEHQPANTPYRASHAIYVRKLADSAFARSIRCPRCSPPGSSPCALSMRGT